MAKPRSGKSKPTGSSRKPAAPVRRSTPAGSGRAAAGGAASRKTAGANPPPSKPQPITQEQIARRAYEIYASGQGGSEHENWIRAERELRGG